MHNVKRSATRLKALWFDSNGYCLLYKYKRLHRAVFELPPSGGGGAVQLNAAELATLHSAAKQVDDQLGRAQFDSLRLRLLKVAAHVTQSVRRILIRLPAAFPAATTFAALARYFAPPAPG